MDVHSCRTSKKLFCRHRFGLGLQGGGAKAPICFRCFRDFKTTFRDLIEQLIDDGEIDLRESERLQRDVARVVHLAGAILDCQEREAEKDAMRWDRQKGGCFGGNGNQKKVEKENS